MSQLVNISMLTSFFYVLKENIDVSSELIHMDENTTSLEYVDCDFNSTHITPMPTQMQYVHALPSKNDGDIKYYVSYIVFTSLLNKAFS